MKNERLTWLSVILTVAVLSIAVCRLDLMLAAVMAVLLGITVYPWRWDGAAYVAFVLYSSVLSSLLLLVSELLDLTGLIGGVYYGGVSVAWLLILLSMTGAAMTAGLMISICLNRYTAAVISKRWMLLFALAFAIGVASIYMFPLSVNLYYSGYAMFNDDIRLDYDRISDRLLMAPSLCSIVMGFLWSVGLRQCSIPYDHNELLQGERYD
ncbi:MAG: hypothetical protein PHF83_07000 [Candidatus Methanomethylophilus sp.]|nr:hypothetical protein [Methanomethylophilus sp.]